MPAGRLGPRSERTDMLKLYGDRISGDCYKPALLLNQLGRPFRWISMDILRKWKAFSAGRDWFVSGRCTVADITLYAHTHVADEGGFGLAAYPAVPRLARAGRGPARL